MTTPAQPTPAPASAKEFFQQDDAALAAAWGVAVPPAEPEVPVIEEVIPLAARGEEEVTPTSAPTTPGTPGVVDLPVLDRKPMTEFSILDTQGEVEIPDVKIKFKAKGQDRELPLDHVVRLAQFGFANEEREQQVLAARKFVAEAEQKELTYQQQIQQYEQHYDRIFNDPAFYEEARIAYMNQNAPEMRAHRAEQQLHRERNERFVEREKQEVVAFTQQTLVPTVQKLLSENPHVTEHEVIGRYTELTAPLFVQGRVPASRFAEVQRLVTDDLAIWVQQRNVEREIDKRGHADKQAREAAAAQQQVAQTKRQASRLFAHQGTPSANPNGPTKPVKYNTAKDWLNAALPLSTE